MRRTWIVLIILALLALPAFAGDETPSSLEVAELAKRVKSYPTKFKLIQMGARAVGPLMEQLTSNDKWLVFESKSALRWIVHHARRNGWQEYKVATQLIAIVQLNAPPAVRRAFAAELLGDLGHASAAEALARAAQVRDATVRAAAIDALRRVPGKAATNQLVVLAGKTEGAHRDAVLMAIGSRGDSAGLPVLLQLAQAGHPAAIRAIGDGGFSGAVTVLKGLCEKRTPGAFEALVAIARRRSNSQLLGHAYGFAVDDVQRLHVLEVFATIPARNEGRMRELVERLFHFTKGAETRVRAHNALIDAAGHGGYEASMRMEVLARVLAESTDQAITLRALAGLGRTGRAEAVTLVAPFVTAEKSAIRTTALTALARLPGKEPTTILIAQLDKAADMDDASLLIRLLEERGSAEAMPALMRVMKDSGGAVKRQAGEALIALADKGSVDEARTVHHQLLEAGVQVAALRGLIRTGDASSIDKIAPFQGAASEELTSLGAAALVAIGDRLVKSDKPNAKKAYRAALEFGAMVENKLRLLGESIEITARGGRVSAWWVAGPFKADQASWAKQEIDPAKVDLKEKLLQDTGGEPSRPEDLESLWQPIQVGGEDAIVDLDSLLSPNDGVVAYAFAEIWVKKARKVVFKAGSDDGIRVWVNGAQVHTVFEPRGITVDGDTFEAELKEGRNELLVKCCEIGGGWGFCLRIETDKGRPLKFKIR